MNDNYREDGLLGGKGFYIALMLCVSIIALAAWMIVQTPTEETPDPVADVQTTPRITAVPPQIREPQPVWQEPEPVEQVTEPVDVQAEPEPVEQVSVKDNVFVWPLVGQHDRAYTMDRLAYDETMGDWRTHAGVDIAAAAGETVRACCAGTVTDVRADDLYGTTVTIDHGRGLVSTYASLQAVPTVKVGDKVMAGDIIGAVGTTALCESAQPPHLHFAMAVDGASVDPGEYLPVL